MPILPIQHTLAQLARLDVLLSQEVQRARRERGVRMDEDYRGLYVSEEDVNRDLTPPEIPGRDASPPSDPPQEQLGLADKRLADLSASIRAGGQVPPSEHLASVFHLTAFESALLLVCLAPEIDLKYERVYAYLQDDVTRKRPTVDLVLRLLCPSVEERVAARAAFDQNSALMRWDLVSLHEDPASRRPVLLSRYLKLDDRIVGFLLGSDSVDARVHPLRVQPDDEHLQLDQSAREQVRMWAGAWSTLSVHRPPVVYLHGRYGTGSSAAAHVLAQGLGRRLLTLDATRLIDPEVSLTQRMLLAEREALLMDAVLCLSGVDELLAPDVGQEANHRAFTRALAGGSVTTVLLGERAWEPGRTLGSRTFFRMELPEGTYAQRTALWTAHLDGSTSLAPAEVQAMASRFRLTPGQISEAVARARSLAWQRDPHGRVSAQDLDAACRAQAQRKLGALAHKLAPRYEWDDIVLPPAQLTTLRLISAMIRQRAVVYGEWGFDRKLATGKGVIALFAGVSGTGKTMAAEILAHDLGLDLFRIDLSAVVNKYIGETEKNLERLFAEAEDGDVILFFDEADALFGKRSGVSDAHDRYANIETGYLLQRTEQYNGLVILASNLPKNMDTAFVRRIHFTVNFPTPEEAERLEIWRRTFPPEAPRGDDLDLEFLAKRLNITGGNIRNVILAAAFLAAEEGAAIQMRHLVRAAAYEFQKMGRMLLEDDFGPYFDFAHAGQELKTR